MPIHEHSQIKDAKAAIAFYQGVFGASEVGPVKDQFYSDRAGSLLDPFGYKWHVMTHKEDVGFDEMQKRCDAVFAAKT